MKRLKSLIVAVQLIAVLTVTSGLDAMWRHAASRLAPVVRQATTRSMIRGVANGAAGGNGSVQGVKEFPNAYKDTVAELKDKIQKLHQVAAEQRRVMLNAERFQSRVIARAEEATHKAQVAQEEAQLRSAHRFKQTKDAVRRMQTERDEKVKAQELANKTLLIAKKMVKEADGKAQMLAAELKSLKDAPFGLEITNPKQFQQWHGNSPSDCWLKMARDFRNRAYWENANKNISTSEAWLSLAKRAEQAHYNAQAAAELAKYKNMPIVGTIIRHPEDAALAAGMGAAGVVGYAGAQKYKARKARKAQASAQAAAAEAEMRAQDADQRMQDAVQKANEALTRAQVAEAKVVQPQHVDDKKPEAEEAVSGEKAAPWVSWSGISQKFEDVSPQEAGLIAGLIATATIVAGFLAR